MALEAEREQVADASRRLAAEGLVLGTAGNVSVRGEDGLVAISPTGAVLKSLDPEQVSVIDEEGNLVDGELEPTSELDLHLGVYRRYDAGAVVHTHAPWPPRSAARSTSCRASTTSSSCSAGPCAWRRTGRSARPSWPR